MHGADTPPTKAQVAVASHKLAQYERALRDLSVWPIYGSERAIQAFEGLVCAGPEGWARLFKIQFDVNTSGDLTRRINSLWGIPSEMSDDMIEKFFKAQRAELAKRSQNETWALLYAAADLRCQHINIDRRLNKMEKLQNLINNLHLPTAESDPILMTVAYLRVGLAHRNDFPAHSFPWRADQHKKAAAIRQIHAWWQKHQEEFKDDD